MNDTAPEVERIWRSRLQRLSPAARIRMACGMFSSARELRRAGAQALAPGKEWDREQMLIDFYSGDLPADVIAAVARRLRGKAPPRL